MKILQIMDIVYVKCIQDMPCCPCSTPAHAGALLPASPGLCTPTVPAVLCSEYGFADDHECFWHSTAGVCSRLLAPTEAAPRSRGTQAPVVGRVPDGSALQSSSALHAPSTLSWVSCEQCHESRSRGAPAAAPKRGSGAPLPALARVHCPSGSAPAVHPCGWCTSLWIQCLQ